MTFPDLIFIVLFAPLTPFLTCSERLASQDLKVMEIFEPGESADIAQGSSDPISSFFLILYTTTSATRHVPTAAAGAHGRLLPPPMTNFSRSNFYCAVRPSYTLPYAFPYM